METALDRDPATAVAPECTHLVETIETLLEVGRRDQAASVMGLMRRCISFSDCPQVESCSAALRRLEREPAA